MKKTIAIILLMVIAAVAVPQHTFAATLYLTPSSGKLVVGDEFTVSVLTDTTGATVNTAESNITFTSDTLELLSVTQGSTFILPAPASPNKGASSAYFGGGLPNPGFNGKDGVLGVMKFRAKAIGRATVNISRGNILLNDGSGSSALVNTTGANFIITAAPVGVVAVTSATHPLQDAWSNHNDIDLSWTLPDKAEGVSYSFDQNPTGVPDDTMDATTQTTLTYPNTNDGVWYFHIKAKGKSVNDPWGPVTNYKIQVDTTPPLPFNINLLSENDTQNVSDTPTIDYKAEDATSGVYRYDIYLDNHLTKELAGEPFAFPKIDSGPHSVRVDAYDKAGNGRETDLAIDVATPSASKPVTFADLRRYVAWPLVAVGLINFLIFGILFMLYKQNKKQNEMASIHSLQLATLQAEIGSITQFEVDLTRLKKQIDFRFMDMARGSSSRMEELRAEIDNKIETEIQHNVTTLGSEINRYLASARAIGKKQFKQMQEQIRQNIADEIAKHERVVVQPAKSYGKPVANDDAKVKVEVLRRLYDEFMNNKT